mgnify:CR=1 FL=1
MKIQSSNITAVNTNMSSVQQKAQLSAEALQLKSVEFGPSFSQRISDGLNGVSQAQNTASQPIRALARCQYNSEERQAMTQRRDRRQGGSRARAEAGLVESAISGLCRRAL